MYISIARIKANQDVYISFAWCFVRKRWHLAFAYFELFNKVCLMFVSYVFRCVSFNLLKLFSILKGLVVKVNWCCEKEK